MAGNAKSGRRMGRATMYQKKGSKGGGVAGSYYISAVARRLLRQAARRAKASESDVLEYCIRVAADSLTRGLAREVAENPDTVPQVLGF
jgi:hypothetical protein